MGSIMLDEIVEAPEEACVTNVCANDSEIRTKKIATSAVSLGVAILIEMIGDTISRHPQAADLNELMSTAILSELNI